MFLKEVATLNVYNQACSLFFFSCWLHPWHMDVLSHSLDLCYSWRNTLTQCTKQELPTALYNYCTWEFIMYTLWVFKTVIMEECNEKDFQVFFFSFFKFRQCAYSHRLGNVGRVGGNLGKGSRGRKRQD